MSTKFYLFANILLLTSFLVPNKIIGSILLKASILILIPVLAKWVIWDSLKYSYRNYVAEQHKLLDTIKHSDK